MYDNQVELLEKYKLRFASFQVIPEAGHCVSIFLSMIHPAEQATFIDRLRKTTPRVLHQPSLKLCVRKKSVSPHLR